MPAFHKKQMKRGKHCRHFDAAYVVILSPAPTDDAKVKLSENWNLNWHRYNITETGEEAYEVNCCRGGRGFYFMYETQLAHHFAQNIGFLSSLNDSTHASARRIQLPRAMLALMRPHRWRRLAALGVGWRGALAKAPQDLKDLLLDIGFPADSVQRVLVLQLLHSWSVPDETLRAAVGRHPELLAATVAELQATAEALQASLPKDVFSELVQKFPEVLLAGRSAVAELQELFSSWGLPWEEAARKAPRLLLRMPQDLSKLLHFLRKDPMGPQLSAEQLAHVAKNYPMLLLGTLDAERQLAPLVRFLRHFLGVDPASSQCIGLYAWPDALAVVEPTARFLVEECGYPLEELREDVALLGYSFEARVQPRGRYVQHLGMARLPLKALTAVDDSHFCQLVDAGKDELYSRRVALDPKGSRVALSFGLPIRLYSPHRRGFLAASCSLEKKAPYMRAVRDETLDIREFCAKDIWVIEPVSHEFLKEQLDTGIEYSITPVLLRHLGSGYYLAISEADLQEKDIIYNKDDVHGKSTKGAGPRPSEVAEGISRKLRSVR
eukprot:s3223_g10.t3